MIRRFLRGDRGIIGEVATCIAGSSDLYADDGRLPTNSINFITCHDGFTLRDLVSYNHKHNEANGEDNRDGTNDNLSRNCGVEGETDDTVVVAFRRRQAKNFIAILMISRGVPMLLAGDEIWRPSAATTTPGAKTTSFPGLTGAWLKQSERCLSSCEV